MQESSNRTGIAARGVEEILGKCMNLKILFLSCALALPYNPVGEVAILRKFLQDHHGLNGYDIILVNEQEMAVGKEYTMTRIHYKNMRVWLRKSA